MIRQRINLRTPLLAYIVRALTLVLALGLVWYGLMVVLLAVKVSPHTVNAISAYRTLYDDVAGIKASDFTTPVRFLVGIAGLIATVVFIYLALQEIPRPYLARGDVDLQHHGAGRDGHQTAGDRARGRGGRPRQRERDRGVGSPR